jgi:hypothetical protein
VPSSFSFVSYTGNGTTQTFNVPFQYISQAHVEVYLDGTLRTTGISWDSATTIRLNPAPNAGAIVRLSRNTPKTAALVDFQDAGILTESALDLNTRQGLLIVQEAFDEASNVISTAVAAAVAASQVAGRSVPTVTPSDVGRFLVGRAADSFGWANNLTFNESTGVLTALGFSGPLTGDVAGNVTGSVTGNVTGNLTGNVTGNVSGTSSNVTGTVALANGGTGATSQAAARTALGLGSAAQLIAGATGSNLVTAATQADARAAIEAAPTGLITSSGFTLSAPGILGRRGAGSGPIESVPISNPAAGFSVGIISGTPVATTSGTQFDSPTIPAGIRRITFMLRQVSTNGTSTLALRLGTSGSFISTGYETLFSYHLPGTAGAAFSSTAHFGMYHGNAAEVHSAVGTLVNLSGNWWLWNFDGLLRSGGSIYQSQSQGYVDLGAALTRFRFTTANGTDIFDSGEFNYLLEY